MGGMDKGLVKVAGASMVSWVVRCLEPQVGQILINANRNLETYAELGFGVVADATGEYLGPLAGIASGMAAADTEYLVTAPCDSPLLVEDLVERLHDVAAASGADIVVAHDGERLQPVFALLRRELLGSLQSYLEAGGRKIDRWYGQHRMAVADFSDCPENFLNINEPGDRTQLEQALERRDRNI